MNISINGKQLDIGDALREHVRARLESGVKKYFARVIDAAVTISRESRGFRADCSVHLGGGMKLQSHGQAVDPYACFDVAAERLDKRLRRYKRRLKNHHGDSDMQAAKFATGYRYVLAAEQEDNTEPVSLKPVIIAESTTNIPLVTVGEAVMRMDLADVSALMFRNIAHGEFNVVYRRSDGNIGWIDPTDQAIGAAKSDRTKDR